MSDGVWADVPGTNGRYEACADGRLKSTLSGKLLTGTVTKKGYRQVRLRYPDGVTRSRFVHRLVLLTFQGDPPPGHVCDHINGVKGDCRLLNLEWVTPKVNSERASALGLLRPGAAFPRGERNPKAKLRAEQVKEARALRRQGIRPAYLARKYGVSVTTMCRALTGKNWGHVRDEPLALPAKAVSTPACPGSSCNECVPQMAA